MKLHDPNSRFCECAECTFVLPTKKILYPVQRPEGFTGPCADFMFWCPGCKCCHGVWTSGKNTVGAAWSFNGDMEKPTFEPSILVKHTRDITDDEHRRIMAGEKLNIPQTICHIFVRNGQIQFLSDCTHELAGKTIPMEAF